MKYIAYKGTVKCERCGYISYYGYQDKDKLCHNCYLGFFRFNAYETWGFNLEEMNYHIKRGLKYENKNN